MTAGEIKALIAYKNGEPEQDKYLELYDDLNKAKQNERNRNTSS